MKYIPIYDTEAKMIEKVADDNDIQKCEVIEMLCEYIEMMKQDNGLK